MPAKKKATKKATAKKTATVTSISGRRKPTAAALRAFEERFAKTHGDGVLIDATERAPYEVISTGSLTLDYRLTVGGLIEGRLHEFWGPDGSGKTTLALMNLAEAQRKHPDYLVAFIDVERKLDLAWAQAMGVDLSRMKLVKPDVSEDVADELKDLLRSGFYVTVVVDSVGAMLPKAELEKDAGDAVVGKHAGIITRMVKIAAVESEKTECSVVLLNQLRANLSYGADVTTGGGFALKHVTTQKLKLRRLTAQEDVLKATIGDEADRQVGHGISIEVERNAAGPSKRTARITLITTETKKYGPRGVDKADEAASMGISTGVIKRSGAWYELPGGDRHNGREKLVAALREDEAMVGAIRTAVLSTVAHEATEEEPRQLADGDGPAFRKGAQG